MRRGEEAKEIFYECGNPGSEEKKFFIHGWGFFPFLRQRRGSLVPKESNSIALLALQSELLLPTSLP